MVPVSVQRCPSGEASTTPVNSGFLRPPLPVVPATLRAAMKPPGVAVTPRPLEPLGFGTVTGAQERPPSVDRQVRSSGVDPPPVLQPCATMTSPTEAASIRDTGRPFAEIPSWSAGCRSQCRPSCDSHTTGDASL